MPIILQVLDIVASTDCIHYLAFGDLLPGDMRQRIAARTMHASVQRLQFHEKGTSQEQCPQLSHGDPCSTPALIPQAVCPEPPALVDVCSDQHSRPIDQIIASDGSEGAPAHSRTARTELPVSAVCTPSFSGLRNRQSAVLPLLPLLAVVVLLAAFFLKRLHP